LRFIHQHVAEAFQRIGGVDDPPVRPIIGAENIYFYRNKMEYSFSEHQWLEYPPAGDETGNSPDTPPTSRPPTTFHPSPVFLGLHVPQRYDKVLDIDECHLQSDVSNRILGFIRDYALKHSLPVYSSRTNSGYLRFLVIRQSRRTGGLMVNCVTFEDWPEVMRALTAELTAAIPEVTTVVNTINDRKAQIAYGDRETVYFGEGVIEERLGRHRFRISAQSFFQTNTEQAERLYAVVRDLAGLSGKETVYDLYSGTGTIALELSDVAWEVVGIESVASSVADAERNAKANNVRNCRFVLGDLKDRLTKDTTWMQELPAPDVLIIDPPRSGMHPGVVEAIRSMRVPRIVYVSCNPATQARDVRMLSPDPYRLLSLQPVDMFPHTYHIENVALLELV
ncbi:MAG: 23S rRNA (uracil(1939)-C(5))-methyltransferase RlmD, partial [Bacteroidota bacterium]